MSSRLSLGVAFTHCFMSACSHCHGKWCQVFSAPTVSNCRPICSLKNGVWLPAPSAAAPSVSKLLLPIKDRSLSETPSMFRYKGNLSPNLFNKNLDTIPVCGPSSGSKGAGAGGSRSTFILALSFFDHYFILRGRYLHFSDHLHDHLGIWNSL